MTTKLPTSLLPISDQVIDHFYKKTPLPVNIGELVNWYEKEAWDDLLSGCGNDELIVLNLNHLAWLKFSDSELIANQESDEPVTNILRIKYARQLISKALENSDGYDCPTVHAVKLNKGDGSTAILGWTMEIHGQGGQVAIFQGAFADTEHFYQSLRNCDFLFSTEQDHLSDEAILELWEKPKEPDQPIVISVEWGNELHNCSMSERTWRLILKGKAVKRVVPYWYEGKKYISEWFFNSNRFGELVVTYDEGGVSFDGNLSDALIQKNEQTLSWQS